MSKRRQTFAIAAIALLAPLSATAQLSCTPIYGGGSQCTDINGPINPSPGAGAGAARTGSSSSVAPTYGGYPLTPLTSPPGGQAPAQTPGDDRGNRTGDLTVGQPTPTFGDSYSTTAAQPPADQTTATPAGSYRTTDAAGKPVTCVPVESGGYRCT